MTDAPGPMESPQHNANLFPEVVWVLPYLGQFLGDMVRSTPRTRTGTKGPFGEGLLAAQMCHQITEGAV